jgi:predicted N-acyltransferase
LICYKNTSTALFYASVENIPSQIWEGLACTKNIYFNPKFLSSLEKNHPNITFSYIVLVDDMEQPIAFASIKIIDFYVEGIKNAFEFLKKIGRKLRVFPHKKPLKLLICGNTFVSGEHGVFIKKNQDKKTIIKELAARINHLVNSNKKLKKQIDAFLLKDFAEESLLITNELKKYKYHAFSVAPNMKLQLHDDWKTFDDYLGAMKTKIRNKN